MSIDALSALVTGRTSQLFREDLRSRHQELEERIGGRRLLVVGGAGSIGAATVRAITAFRPDALHVVDQNENNLAELIRDLRSSSSGVEVRDFRALPLDFGSPVMHRLLLEAPPYDLVLNFAALKHVRSEKDTYSLLQMLDTNVVKAARFLKWLSEKHSEYRYFSISTDKAANPTSLMGASKRIMEHLIFSGEVALGVNAHVNSARFANVAFSDGSLLHSFLKRFNKRQPLAVPSQTRRYFITLREAGQLCLLAAVCGPHRHVVIPRLDPANDLQDLQSIAAALIRHWGFEPRVYEDEVGARTSVDSDRESGYYPLLITQLDTSGEKPYEEFLGRNEESSEIGMAALLGVKYVPAPSGSVEAFLRMTEELVARPEVGVTKAEIVAWFSLIVSHLRHNETGKTLDERV